MIQTYSTTIRRKEMDAVLTCMVDEKIGPGELNQRLISTVKEFFCCDGAVAVRSPVTALKYALRALDLEPGSVIMISALAPLWHLQAVEDLGYKALVLDVDESSGVVTADIVHQGLKDGGRVLLLHETNGIIPDMASIMALNIPVIEDVSQSAGAVYSASQEEGEVPFESKKAGMYGVFSIMGLEERDVITCGGGAVLMCPRRREWVVLKRYTDQIAKVELLPDISCALAWIQLKEYVKNETVRKEIFSIFARSCMQGRHKMFVRTKKGSSQDFSDPVPSDNSENTDSDVKTEKPLDMSSTMSNFPLVLSTAFKDVKQYGARKDIQISLTFENSVIAARQEELSEKCIKAKSLYLRCADFPLYPRLSKVQVAKISKILGTLP